MADDKVTFEDFTIKVMGNIDDRIDAVLEECVGELASQVKRNTPTGRGYSVSHTKNAWDRFVDSRTHTAYVGNYYDTAIYLEFGTGEYALEHNGRKGGWWIPVGRGKGQISEKTAKAYGFKMIEVKGKKFAFTYGMKPRRPLWKAYNSLKDKIIKRIQESLKGL